MFKIVIREGIGDTDGPEVLAFIYPQLAAGYFGKSKDFRHGRFLTTVDEIEKLTGLDFLTNVPDAKEKKIEKVINDMWKVPAQKDFIGACSD